MKKLAIFLSLFLIFATQSIAQKYIYLEFKPSDGYPSSVNSIHTQEFGLTYFSTDDGLYILTDNDSFERYEADGTDGQAGILLGDNVYQVVEDKEGFLWILTDKGYVGFKNRSDNYNATTIKGEGIATCAASKDGVVYFGAEEKVWKFDHSTGEFKPVLKMANGPGFSVQYLMFGNGDAKDDLYIFNKSGGHLVFDTLTKIPRDAGFQSSDSRYVPYVEKRSRVWLSCFNEGVYCLGSDGSVVSHYTKENSGLSSNTVLCFAEKDGNLWMGTEGGGISILDYKTGNISSLTPMVGSSNTFPASTVTTMFCDHNGNMWCGRPSGGVFVICEPMISHYRLNEIAQNLSTEGISCFFQDGRNDYIWIGTKGSGILRFDPKSGEFKEYASTKGMNIYSMCGYGDGKILLSCPNVGLFVFDKTNGRISNPGIDLGIDIYHSNGKNGISLVNDKNGNVIASSDKLQTWIPGKKETLIVSRSEEGDFGMLKPVFGSEGSYYFDHRRIYAFNNEFSSLKMIFEPEEDWDFKSASIDEDGSIWITAKGSLLRFTPRNGEYQFTSTNYSSAPSLVLCDNSRRVWTTTQKRVVVNNIVSKSTKALGEYDGVFDNEYAANARLMAANGDIYFGGRNGMIRIPANFQMEKSLDPEVVVYDVTVDDRRITDLNDCIVPGPHSTIILHFFARTQNLLSDNSYRFLVEGPKYSNEIETGDPSLSFSDLKSGQYVISASCTNENGVWTPMEKVFEFKVQGLATIPWLVWALAAFLAFAILTLMLLKTMNTRDRKALEEIETEKIQSDKDSAAAPKLTEVSRDPMLQVGNTGTAASVPERSKVSPSFKGPSLRKLKPLKEQVLLFVDDDKDLRDFVYDEFKDLCKEMYLAYNGIEALEQLSAHNIDAVISDLMMPDMDGLELSYRIKTSEEYCNIPVILLTARADEASILKGYEAKADLYMQKPFDIDELAAALEGKGRHALKNG